MPAPDSDSSEMPIAEDGPEASVDTADIGGVGDEPESDPVAHVTLETGDLPGLDIGGKGTEPDL